jgi:uncharacterized protein involved in exopolysaccharide biosynthesis
MTKVRTLVGVLLGPLLRLRILSLRQPENRLRRYGLMALGGLSLIWLVAIAVLRVSPDVYTSRWTLILPGAGSDASLFLQGIGQASSNSASPYASISRSPRVNYREIVTSDTVLQQAAEIADMTPAEFGKPRVKLIQQSSLMSFSISGDSAEQTYRKAQAVNEALHLVLNSLRNDELALRETGMRSAMDSYSRRMTQARTALLAHQTETQLITADQLDELIYSVENFERKLIEVSADLEQKSVYLKTLTESLNVSEELAAAAVVLHADEAVRQLMQQYVNARSVLEGKGGVFGPNHPRMVAAQATLDAVTADIKNRAAELLGRNDIDVRRLVLLDVEDSTGSIFRDLVLTAANLQGARAKRSALAEQLEVLRGRLQQKVVGVARLADLERDHKIAEAVFSSALARVDTGKADLFVSYPLVQTIVKPGLPASADARPAQFVVAGATAASLCFLMGLAILWFRTPVCARTPKN